MSARRSSTKSTAEAPRGEKAVFPGKLVIGITGGVGSGKSVVLHALEKRYDAEILEADAVSREIMEPGGSAYEAVIRLLGREILREDGSLDRSQIAELIYGDPEKRLALNALVHPLTIAEIRKRIEASDKKLIAYEAALPRQARFSELCDRVLYVFVPEEERIRRLMAGRGYSEEKCRSIMASQLSEAEFREASHYAVDNSKTVEETVTQLCSWLESLLRKA